MFISGRESMRNLINGRGGRLAITRPKRRLPLPALSMHTYARGVHASCKVVPPFDYGLRGCFYQAKG